MIIPLSILTIREKHFDIRVYLFLYIEIDRDKPFKIDICLSNLHIFLIL